MRYILAPAGSSQLAATCIHLNIFTHAKMCDYTRRVNTLPALILAAAGVGFGHAVLPDHWLPLAVLSRTRRYRPLRTVRLSLAAAMAHVVVSLALGAVLLVVGLQFRSTIARHTDLIVGALLLATGAVFLVLDLLGKGHGHSHDDARHHEHGHGHTHHPHGHSEHVHEHDHADGDPSAEHQTHSHTTTTAVLERPHTQTHTEVLAAHSHLPNERPHAHAHPHDPDRRTWNLTGLLIPFGAAASPDLTILPIFLAAGALGVTAAFATLAAFALTTIATIVGLTVATALGARLLTAPWIDKRANLITALTLIVIGALVATSVI
jgi:nickel/cobalt transporter (NicO) family protein